MNSDDHTIIGVDARPLSRGNGGIQSYAREIIERLADDLKPAKIILYCDRPIPGSEITKKSNVSIRNCPQWGIKELLWFFWINWRVNRDRLTLFWSPRHHLPMLLPAKTNAIVTIHDLVWKSHPKTMPIRKWLVERFSMPGSLKRADSVICVSATTETDVLRNYGGLENKTSVILNGVNLKLQNIKSDQSLSEHPSYFLAVGSIEPRKNYLGLLEGFEAYRARGGKKRLYIVGATGWKHKHILKKLKTTDHRDYISLEIEVSDERLSHLYRRADGYICCSLHEGFGLPTMDAVGFNIPIALSDIPIHKELYTLNNIWFAPENTEEIAQALELLDDCDKPSTSENSLSVATVYSWDASAEKHTALFKKLLNNI